jgi:hypothetical protein
MKSDIMDQFKIFDSIAKMFDSRLDILSSNSTEIAIPTIKSPNILVFGQDIFRDSLILTCSNQKITIDQWINISALKATLLWRGTRDGFSSSKFHSRCDNKGATFTVIKSSDGYIFGGYLSVSWNSSGNFISDSQAWLFSLNLPYINLVKLKCKSPAEAACGNSECGPTFGGGNDISVSSDCNGNVKAYLQLGDKSAISTHYNSGYNYSSYKKFIYGGEPGNLAVSEIEVYQLG